MKQTFEPFPEVMWLTAVQVATVWTNPESARAIDVSGTGNPTDIDDWIASLTYETNLALCDENRVQTQLLYGEPVLITAGACCYPEPAFFQRRARLSWLGTIEPAHKGEKDELDK